MLDALCHPLVGSDLRAHCFVQVVLALPEMPPDDLESSPDISPTLGNPGTAFRWSAF